MNHTYSFHVFIRRLDNTNVQENSPLQLFINFHACGFVLVGLKTLLFVN